MRESVKRSNKRCPTHPGAFLREIVLPAPGRPKVEVAAAPGISRQTLYDILSERQPVTAHMAVRLAKLFGNTPPEGKRLLLKLISFTLTKAAR